MCVLCKIKRIWRSKEGQRIRKEIETEQIKMKNNHAQCFLNTEFMFSILKCWRSFLWFIVPGWNNDMQATSDGETFLGTLRFDFNIDTLSRGLSLKGCQRFLFNFAIFVKSQLFWKQCHPLTEWKMSSLEHNVLISFLNVGFERKLWVKFIALNRSAFKITLFLCKYSRQIADGAKFEPILQMIWEDFRASSEFAILTYVTTAPRCKAFILRLNFDFF